MKVDDLLNTLTTRDKVVIYGMRRQDKSGIYIDIFFKGENGFDMVIDENILQREVTLLTVYENILFIEVDGDEDET